MSDALETRISLDDLKDKARRIGDLATAEVKQVTHERGTQLLVVGVVVVAMAITAAYYLGSRRCEV